MQTPNPNLRGLGELYSIGLKCASFVFFIFIIYTSINVMQVVLCENLSYLQEHRHLNLVHQKMLCKYKLFSD